MKTLSHIKDYGLFSCIMYLAIAMGGPINVSAQVNSPSSLGAYGGATLFIETMAVPAAANKTRVFVATLSANSVFYADVDHSLANPFGTNMFFRTAPGLSALGNHGTPWGIAAHAPSGRLFVSDNNEGLFSCTTNADSFVTNYVGWVFSVLVQGSSLFFIQWDTTNYIFNLHYGNVNEAGTFTENPTSPYQLLAGGYDLARMTLAVHPTNNLLYIAFHGTNLFLKSSTTYDAFSGATVFTPFGVSATVSNWIGTSSFRPLVFGPDGRMFFSSYVSGLAMEYVTYSDDDGATWSAPVATTGGQVTKAVGSASSYSVYSGRGISTNKGVSWAEFGSMVPGARVITGSDKPVAADPYYPQIVYCVSERGAGVTTNNGLTPLLNISRGIEALVITDFDVTPSKNIAWTASMSGVYRATNFNVAPCWNEGVWPAGEENCRSIGLDKSDTNGTTVYVGGFYLSKTTDGGGANGTNWVRVLTPTNFGVTNLAIVSAVKASGNTVFAGCYGPYDSKGGLFRSTDGGSNWIEVTVYAGGVDVNDILLTEENGAKVAYVAVARDDNVKEGSGLYRIVNDTVSREVSDPVSIRKLAVNSSGNVYASGLDANTNVVVYYKDGDFDAWIWRTLVLSNYPTFTYWSSSLWCGGLGPVITIGLDSASNEVPYMTASASQYSIYYLSSTSLIWQTSSDLAYPVGSQIYVLYWDDLVVGTSIGLYGQTIQVDTNQPVPPASLNTCLAADFDGDNLADPAVYNTNGTWKVRLSSANYTLIPLVGLLGESGYTALVADFDGDGLADPTIYSATLELWAVKLSTLGYLAPTIITSFGGSGWAALAGDFDGDGLADLGLYNTNGTWKVKLSTANYTTVTCSGLLGLPGWTAVAADFDGDGLVDPTIYNAATGSWIIMLSRSNYYVAVIEAGFLGATGYTGLGADFDNDGLADPTVAQTSTGNWEVRLSSGNYVKVPLPGFLGE